MLIASKCFREYISHILVFVYVRVIDNWLSLQISIVVIANIDVYCLSVDDSRGDTGESTLIVSVDWHQL
jgi:hypothetical protein